MRAAEQSTDLASPEGIYLAENLEFLQGVPDNSIDLVYIDPPFGTGQTRRLQSIRTGAGDKVRTGFGGRTYRFDVVSDRQYSDDMALQEYLAFLEAVSQSRNWADGAPRQVADLGFYSDSSPGRRLRYSLLGGQAG